MAEYHAISSNYFTFEISKLNEPIGKLSYNRWYEFDANIDFCNGSSYQLETHGLWNTSIILKDGDKVLLKFQLNWNGEIVFEINPGENSAKDFVIRPKGIFKSTYVLLDQEEEELIFIQPILKWKKMNFEYKIETSDRFEDNPAKHILLMAAIHSANYYVAMMNGMG